MLNFIHLRFFFTGIVGFCSNWEEYMFSPRDNNSDNMMSEFPWAQLWPGYCFLWLSTPTWTKQPYSDANIQHDVTKFADVFIKSFINTLWTVTWKSNKSFGINFIKGQNTTNAFTKKVWTGFIVTVQCKCTEIWKVWENTKNRTVSTVCQWFLQKHQIFLLNIIYK